MTCGAVCQSKPADVHETLYLKKKKTNKNSCLLKQSCNLATENHAVRNLPKHLNDEVEEKAGNIIPFLGNSPTPKTPATNEMTSFGSPDLRN